MKKVLSSILVGAMLIASVGIVSVFADEPKKDTTTSILEETTGCQQNIEIEIKNNTSRTEKPFELSKPSEKNKSSETRLVSVKKNIASISDCFCKAKSILKEINENKLKYIIITGGILLVAAVGVYLDCANVRSDYHKCNSKILEV